VPTSSARRWAGWWPQLAALDHPERVESLTLLSTSPTSPSDEASGLPGPSDELLSVFETLAPPERADRAAVTTYIVEFSRALAGSLPFDEAGLRALTARVLDRTTDVEAMLTNHDVVINSAESWRSRLDGLPVPTLVIHGTDDPLFPLAHGKALAGEIPSARLLTMDRAGHELPTAVWHQVTAAVLEHTQGGH
jgi:pimeloyl-ACP methyl ester carboxylesterase